jgi:hypothetical protein
MTDDASGGTPLERAAQMVEWQATACGRLGSRLYELLLRRVADDVRAGGVCARALAGYEDAPGPAAVALRLAGGVHALVLTGRAPELAAHYPSAGGEFREEREAALWAAFRAAVEDGMEWVREWMTRPPQTNEVGRAAGLLAGLLRAVSRHPLPVRLFELGASGGLNLRADAFRMTGPGFAWGPEDSPVRLEDAWRQPVPAWLPGASRAHPALTVLERRGCDIRPVDPSSAEGALALRAYLWPDQTARAARLEGALRVAREVPAEVVRAGVDTFLSGVELRPGTLTVVWHSVMRQYVPAAQWSRAERELDRLASGSGPDAAFAHVAFEPRRVGRAHPFRLSVRVGDEAEELLAGAPGHGLPAHGLDGA